MKRYFTHLVRRFVFGLSLAMSVGFATSSNVASAADPIASFVDLTPNTALTGGFSDSRHVIDLLMRNEHRRRILSDPRQTPPAGIPIVSQRVPGPDGRPVLMTRRMGDLELIDVSMVSEATVHCGPVFQVTFCNHSTVANGNFRISIVAVLGRIEPLAPVALVNIPRIEAGQTLSIQMTLPVSSMSMGRNFQTPFSTLVVALDSFDMLQENNELNNVLTLNRASIKLLVPEVVPVPGATATPITSTLQSRDPIAATPVVPSPSKQNVESPKSTPEVSPLDKIDFDSLDTDDVEGAAVLIQR